MSRPHSSPILSKPQSLSDATTTIVYQIPQLLRRLRDLENEEAELDAKTRQLVEQFRDTTKDGLDKPSTPARSIIFTSKPRGRTAVGTSTPRTPPHIDPKSIETPMRAFLLTESFALALSIKSKRKGRVFMTGDSTEFGERR